MDRLSLGPVGVALNVSESYLGEAAAELERLGYSALWLPGGQIDNLDRLAEVVRATKTARAGRRRHRSVLDIGSAHVDRRVVDDERGLTRPARGRQLRRSLLTAT